jgi:hypothetical protein
MSGLVKAGDLMADVAAYMGLVRAKLMDLAAAVAWYCALAVTPGWKAYTRHRVAQMAEEFPAVFGELPALVRAQLEGSA